MADEIPFADVIAFGHEQAQREVDSQEGDVPKHSGSLIASRGVGVLKAVENIRMRNEREDMDDVGDDETKDQIEEAAVDLLLALGALDYEYDLDLPGAFEYRKDFIEAANAYEEAMKEADTKEEAVDAFNEHMGEYEEMFADMTGGTIDVGDNVDNESYDPDERDRHLQ